MNKNQFNTYECIIEYHTRVVLEHKKIISFYYSNLFKTPSLNIYKKDISEHDEDKLFGPNFIPYVWASWEVFCKKNLDKKITDYYFCPEKIYDKINVAKFRHSMTSPHHPEFHCPNKQDVMHNIFFENSFIQIDATTMPFHDILEMVADWKATSVQARVMSCEDWAEMNIGSRWLFSDKQKDFINFAIKSLSNLSPPTQKEG